MGLDMYLDMVLQMSCLNDDEKVKVTVQNVSTGDTVEFFSRGSSISGEGSVTSVRVRACYWRKANQIHKWFVDTRANGKDDCSSMHVEVDHLKELRELCAQVVAAENTKGAFELASKLLPTSRGFFFGSQEYDEYYYNDLRETIGMIDRALEVAERMPKQFWVAFEYTASW